MNIAFFGSPEISDQFLRGLMSGQNSDFTVSLVATQPDRPAGKRLELQETKIKTLAKEKDIPIFDKDIPAHSVELSTVLKKHKIELCIVYAYGGYIPKSLLNLPTYGFINVHPSLLPKYRGPSPTVFPLILGEKETGVTLIRLNDKLDEGDIISQEKTEITKDENRIELEKRLTKLGVKITSDHIHTLLNGRKISLLKQDQTKAVVTRLINKNDGFMSVTLLKKALQNESLTQNELPELLNEYKRKYPLLVQDEYLLSSAQLIYNYYRGFYGWPGIWTIIHTSTGDKRLKLTKVSFSSNNLSLVTVQLEGKKEVNFKTFNKSYNIF